MELYDTPANPCPPGANVTGLRTRDGVELRAAWWRPEGAPGGTVCVIQGRAEFIEKYYETIGELLARGYVVAAFDWRGQGLSKRLLGNRAKGYVRGSKDYRRDLDAFVQQVLTPDCPKPWFALAHSMGAAAVLDHGVAKGGSPFARIVGTAPMLSLGGFGGTGFARSLAGFLRWTGLGRLYIPGGGPHTLLEKPFAHNILTGDRRRFERAGHILAASPDLGIGDPTVAWLHSAYRLMNRLAEPDFAESVKTPVLMVAAGDERLVSTPAVEAFARRLKNGACLVFPGARHEILMERPEIRAKFWAAFDAFIPGDPFLHQAAKENSGA
jgi:lysophospholipase